MVISDGEKLILSMLRDLYKHLDVKGEIDPDFVSEVIWGGHHWALKWQYPGIFEDHVDSEEAVSETVDIIDMWYLIEHAYDQFSQQDKDQIEIDAKPFGKNVKFRGFDGNSEGEYIGIANMLINKMDRWEDFKGRDLNAHMPTIDMYRRMLTVYEPIRNDLMNRNLSPADVTELLKSMMHPENGK